MSTVNDLPPSAQILNGNQARFDYRVDDSGQKMRITWKVTWEESPQFLQAVKGYSQQIGGITRTVPLQNPFVSSIYAVGITGRGMGADANISASRPYVWMIYDVDFAALPYGVDGDSAYITLSHSGSSRSISIPGNQYQFGSGLKIQSDQVIQVGGVGIQLGIHQVPSLSAFIAVAGPLIGKVNSTTFVCAGISYAPGTVRFETFDTLTTKSVLGSPQTEVGVSLIYSDLPWNKGIRPDGVADDIVPAPFQLADLNALIF